LSIQHSRARVEIYRVKIYLQIGVNARRRTRKRGAEHERQLPKHIQMG
jgi:hypothetical protein